MDELRAADQPGDLHTGVDGLGFTGRDVGDDGPTISDDGVAGLGFGGRPQPDEFDGDRFVVAPEPDGDDEVDEPDVDEPEDAVD